MLELFNIPYLITHYGYLGVSIIVFLESGIFFPLPGDSLLFTAGVLASTGYLKIYLLVPIIFVSTFLGGVTGYYMGVHIDRLRKYSFFAKILREDHMNKAHDFFEKHGKVAVVFCRFVPVVRTFTPIVAGLVKMDFDTFLKYSFFGSVLWSTIVTFLGYFLGQVFPQIKDYMGIILIVVVLVSFLPIVIEMVRKRKE
ncbi:MAG: DedA family protein [bacterium]|nr:DedA family protein [bacterium]